MNFDEYISDWVDAVQGGVVTAVEAGKLVAQAREKFPSQLAEWLDGRAEQVVSNRMGDLLRSQRATAQRRRSSRTFAEIADQIEAGEITVAPLDAPYPIEGSYRPLRSLTYDDLEILATGYETSSAQHAFEAARLRAVQKRLPKNGSKTVGDVLDDKQLARMWSALPTPQPV